MRPGLLLKQLMTDCKVDVSRVAQRADTAPVYIQDIIRGKMNVTLGIAKELEKVFNIPIEEWMEPNLEDEDQFPDGKL